jgi:peptidoglycan pentaglycine glycine transferase (the first glycine)
MSMSASPWRVRDTLTRSVRIVEVRDRNQWDDAISLIGGSLLQSWEWGEFKYRHGWTAHRLLGTKDGHPKIAAQVLVRPVGPMSVLYVPRGPASANDDESVFSTLTLAIDSLAQRNRSAIAFMEPEDSIPDALSLAGSLGWQPSPVELQPLRTIKVRVDRSDDEILSGMKNKTRYNVRLAGRRGVTVRSGDISEIVSFYEVLQETSERDSFGIHGVEYYADMLDIFGDSAALLLAEIDGEIAAGVIVLKHGTEATYMFGASSRAHQRHMPTHLLQFEAMRWAREKGCIEYDLWGIPATNTPPDEAADDGLNVRSGLWGVYRFKQGLGGEITSYPGVFERQYYPRLVQLWRQFRTGPGA